MRWLIACVLCAGCGGGDAGSDGGPLPDLAVPAPDLTMFPICEGPTPTGDPFDDGAGGTDWRTLAADFTVPTLDGDWSFKANWTGCDSYLFILDIPSNGTAQQLWQSSVDDLLAVLPDNVHLLFGSYGVGTASADVSAMKARVDSAVAALAPSDQMKWKGRFHYITAPMRMMNNWVSTLLINHGGITFGIDRLQRIRQTGLLEPVTGQQEPLEMDYLANEARYYNFEWTREQKLRAEKTPTIVHVLDGTTMDQIAYADFPDAATMKGFDTMELDLGMWCQDHDETNCAQWDYIQDLVLCDPATLVDAGVPDGGVAPCSSGTIMGRFITTYHREGRWVVDVSPLLAYLQDGGRRAFHYNSQYLNALDIRLSNSGKGGHPSSAVPLWNGEWNFDKTYNSNFMPQTVPIPADATRVQLFAFISGHGFGTDTENCAEFCDHEHRFTVGGVEYVKDFPDAGSEDGCLQEIDVGTVPNQYGTWPFGRGGWCPGLEVAPYVVDVTSNVTPGMDATLSYRGTFMGADFVPKPVNGNNGGFGALIRLQSWLVFWTK